MNTHIQEHIHTPEHASMYTHTHTYMQREREREKKRKREREKKRREKLLWFLLSYLLNKVFLALNISFGL